MSEDVAPPTEPAPGSRAAIHALRLERSYLLKRIDVINEELAKYGPRTPRVRDAVWSALRRKPGRGVRPGEVVTLLSSTIYASNLAGVSTALMQLRRQGYAYYRAGRWYPEAHKVKMKEPPYP